MHIHFSISEVLRPAYRVQQLKAGAKTPDYIAIEFAVGALSMSDWW